MIEANIQRFFHWINERQAIYLNRQAGWEWPWTDDKILQTYSFTNPFRENDKVTVWLRENWREPFADHPCLYLNLAMFRQFNWPATMELTGFVVDDPVDIDGTSVNYVWDPQKLTDVVEVYQRAGNKVYTGAYMIRGPCINPTGIQWTTKAQYMFHKVLDPLWWADEPDWQNMSLQEATKWFQQFEGFGPFLSYEVATDMRHTRYLENAPDIMTWANPGPGAMRGIHRLYGWPAKATKKKEGWYVEQMQHLLKISPDYLEDYVPALEMREVEHSLCEFDKYERVMTGEGRPRSKYSPPK